VVEVGGDREAAGAQAEGAGLGGCHGERPDFRQRAFALYDDEGFSCLDALEKSLGIALNILHADATHALIVLEGLGRTSGRLPKEGPDCASLKSFLSSAESSKRNEVPSLCHSTLASALPILFR
jgi:hypothetical protein